MPANSKVEKQILINAESWGQRLEQVVKITDKMGQIKHFVLHHEDAIKGDKSSARCRQFITEKFNKNH